jgi:hypothetical protein
MVRRGQSKSVGLLTLFVSSGCKLQDDGYDTARFMMVLILYMMQELSKLSVRNITCPGTHNTTSDHNHITVRQRLGVVPRGVGSSVQ